MIHDVVAGLEGFVNADSWAEFIWVGFVLIAVAAFPAWISTKNAKGIKDIKNQVVNGHTSPLRFDLDKVIVTLNEMGTKVDLISHGLDGLRNELMHEEDRRRSGISELRQDFDRRIDHLNDRLDR